MVLILRSQPPVAHGGRCRFGPQRSHVPVAKTLEDFDFKFQSSIDAKLVRELATGRFVANAENLLLFGPPGVGKTHP